MTHTDHPAADDHQLLHSFWLLRRHARKTKPHEEPKLTLGQWLADAVAAGMGSWAFIGTQSFLLMLWVVYNIVAEKPFDAFPFILLNLMLSFQAAYAAPFIMMSQNRQSQIDRQRAIDDYTINCKAELEIEQLHAKIDEIRQLEILRLQRIIEELSAKLDKAP
ncbi:MAG TPA: hypothetical protein DCL54_01895 [Alphaproteobacteria bacterium]|nr:hypothetical protein [Alphaproteobacteria bacterium]HAJ45316.1 hypothetical protein [Alphaproteobacteria bacterium]